MSLTQEVLTVEAVTQYGFRANGRNYGISPKLKETGIEPQSFSKGNTYNVEVYTGPKGGKSVNSFSKVDNGVPSLPPTTVTATKAPGGEPVVKPAQKRVETSNIMSKEEWREKDRRIETQAILKSVLESPVLAQMAVGKNELEVLKMLESLFSTSLTYYYTALQK